MTRESPLDSDVDAIGAVDLVRLGQRIAEARKQCGWTQADLAEAAGISRVTVSKIERGTTDVGYVRLVRLARALSLVCPRRRSWTEQSLSGWRPVAFSRLAVCGRSESRNVVPTVSR